MKTGEHVPTTVRPHRTDRPWGHQRSSRMVAAGVLGVSVALTSAGCTKEITSHSAPQRPTAGSLCDNANAYVWFVDFMSRGPKDSKIKAGSIALAKRIQALQTQVPAAQKDNAHAAAEIWMTADQTYKIYNYDPAKMPQELPRQLLAQLKQYKPGARKVLAWAKATCASRYPHGFPATPSDAPS